MRIILYSNKSGSVEKLFFTEDTESPVEELVYLGGDDMTIDADFNTDDVVEFPSGFPVEHTFQKI